MRLIMLGAPGVGKGTQSKLLCKKYNIPQISTGDILRAAKEANTDLGKQVKEIMAAGDLVSDEIVNKLVEDKLQSDDCKNGFILDGYPRTAGQAKTLDNLLERLNITDLRVINIYVPSEQLVQRLINRRKCKDCGTDFNLLQADMPEDGTCPTCGSCNILIRADDKETAVRNRQETYEEQTQPLIDYYDEKGLLYSFDGLKDIQDVFLDIDQVINT